MRYLLHMTTLIPRPVLHPMVHPFLPSSFILLPISAISPRSALSPRRLTHTPTPSSSHPHCSALRPSTRSTARSHRGPQTLATRTSLSDPSRGYRPLSHRRGLILVDAGRRDHMGAVARRVCGVSGPSDLRMVCAVTARRWAEAGLGWQPVPRGMKKRHEEEASRRTHIIGPTHLLIRSSAGSHSAILIPSSPHFASPEDQIAPNPSSSTSMWLPRRSDLEGKSSSPDCDSV